jgi:hypothetical protein
VKAQIDELERQLTADLKAEADKRAKDAEAAAKKQAEGWKTANSEIMSAENKLVSEAIQGRKSMSQIMEGIALDMAQKEIEADLRALTQRLLFQAERVASAQATEKGGVLFHLLGEAQKTAATAAGTEARVAANASGAAQTAAINSAQNVKDVTGSAAVAAANAYKAMAGIPVIGPELGAAAAVATFAAVESYGAMASLAVGTNVVPNDMIAQIHAGERIMPAADNRAIIAALNGGSASGARGDVHFHNNFAPQVQPRGDWREDMRRHADDMFSMIQMAVRNGRLKFG